MAMWDSAWCLTRFNQLSGRPETGDSILDDAKYVRLTEAQVAIVADVMTRAPKSLNPKVPYPLFPVATPNGQTDASGTVTISGADFSAGATLTLTATVAQFSAGSVGRIYSITNPSGLIPLQVEVTAYTSTTIVSAVAAVAIPATMQAVALSGWAVLDTYAPDGQVFTFGVMPDGYPIMPMGEAKIFQNLSSWPDYPMVEGWDYISEGTQIRIPNNRTWGSPLYWYGVVQPPPITASSQPILFPEGSRELIPLKAAAMLAEEGEGNSKLADRLEMRYREALSRWLLAWRTQWNSGGVLGSLTGLQIGQLGGTTNGMSFTGSF